MPNQRKEGTRRRTIAVENTLWHAAAEAAKAEGTTRSEVCRDALAALVERRRGGGPPQLAAFYEEHYSDWTVHKLPLMVYVPTKDWSRMDALALVRQILDEAALDIRARVIPPEETRS